MSIFIDTSAFIAVLSKSADEHDAAARTWEDLLASDEELVTSNYIVVETCALAQRRAGIAAVRRFLDDVLPVVQVQWVDMPLHSDGVRRVLFSARHGPNIVDCVSFAVMRKLGMRSAFAFGEHFRSQGFRLLPR
jgi:predicted nucleic acid-binding protein